MKRGGSKSGFSDKQVPVTQPPSLASIEDTWPWLDQNCMQNFKSFGPLGAELQAPPYPRTQTLLPHRDQFYFRPTIKNMENCVPLLLRSRHQDQETCSSLGPNIQMCPSTCTGTGLSHHRPLLVRSTLGEEWRRSWRFREGGIQRLFDMCNIDV